MQCSVHERGVNQIKDDIIFFFSPRLTADMDKAGSVIDGLNTPQGKFWIIGILLHFLEKNMKDEFVCPCDRFHNIITSSLYSGIPFSVALLVAYRALDNKVEKKCLYALATAMTWLSFCLLDGRYMTCGFSGTGEYTRTNTLKFCKPSSGNDTVLLESKLQAQMLMAYSQVSTNI